MKTTLSDLQSRFHKLGFRVGRCPECLDSPRAKDGFLRVAFEDGQVEFYHLTSNGVLEWKLELSLSLPQSVFDAALSAVLTEAGIKPKMYRARLNGRPALVTIPE